VPCRIFMLRNTWLCSLLCVSCSLLKCLINQLNCDFLQSESKDLLLWLWLFVSLCVCLSVCVCVCVCGVCVCVLLLVEYTEHLLLHYSRGLYCLCLLFMHLCGRHVCFCCCCCLWNIQNILAWNIQNILACHWCSLMMCLPGICCMQISYMLLAWSNVVLACCVLLDWTSGVV
jgi:hypothetical protein